ncbi:MAG: GTPase ObgE, partial [archaeon]
MIDEVSFVVKAGDGGDGQVSFSRDKNGPNGGPDGGNGSNGGSIYIESNSNINTLYNLAGRKNIFAENGKNGKRGRRNPEKTADITLEVPVGTMVYNAHTDKLILDMNKPGMRFCLAHGGKGGEGNWRFKSSTNVTPME